LLDCVTTPIPSTTTFFVKIGTPRDSLPGAFESITSAFAGNHSQAESAA